MYNTIKQRIKARSGRNRVEKGKTFCGHNGGSVVHCRPGECYRLENLCRHKLKVMAEKHHSLLQALRDHAVQQSNESNIPVSEIAIQRYGIVVGTLVVMAAEKESKHA